VVVKVTAAGLGELAHEVESALELDVVGVLLAPAAAVVAAAALAGLLVGSALAEAVAGLVADVADRGVGDLRVGESGLDDVRDELVDADADLLLLAEDNEVLRRRIGLVALTGEDIGDVVLRDGSLVVDAELGGRDLLGDLGVADKVTPGDGLELGVAVLAGDGGGVVLRIVEGVTEDGLEGAVVAVDIDRVEPTVRPAGSDVGVELGVAEAGIRRGVDRSRGDDVHVLGDLLLVPHGARVAGRHEEDELLVHALALPDLEDLSDVRVADELASGHGNDARATVIIIVDKDIAALVRLESLAASGGGLTLHNSKEVLEVAVLASVVLGNTFIDVPVLTLRIVDLVVDSTREGIGARVGKIIIVHHNDVSIRDASTVGKLIGMVDTGLVTVVGPAIAASNENSPGGRGIAGRKLVHLGAEGIDGVSNGESNKKSKSKSELHLS